MWPVRAEGPPLKVRQEAPFQDAMRSVSWPPALVKSPPTKRAGPVLRAGLTDALMNRLERDPRLPIQFLLRNRAEKNGSDGRCSQSALIRRLHVETGDERRFEAEAEIVGL